MAKITYAPGIEVVSGALSKIKTKSMHAQDDNMFLATHRNAATLSKSCSRAYYRKVYELPWQNGKTPSAKVLSIRSKFAVNAAAIKTRRADLMAIGADQQNFLSLREGVKSATGVYPTLNVFYWAAAKKYSDNNLTAVTWPQGGIELTVEELSAAVSAARLRMK